MNQFLRRLALTAAVLATSLAATAPGEPLPAAAPADQQVVLSSAPLAPTQLLATPGDISSLRVVDFGLAKDTTAEAMVSTCGSPVRR